MIKSQVYCFFIHSVESIGYHGALIAVGSIQSF